MYYPDGDPRGKPHLIHNCRGYKSKTFPLAHRTSEKEIYLSGRKNFLAKFFFFFSKIKNTLLYTLHSLNFGRHTISKGCRSQRCLQVVSTLIKWLSDQGQHFVNVFSTLMRKLCKSISHCPCVLLAENRKILFTS